MFLDSDERVIIMDMLGGVSYAPKLLSLDSLRQLAGVGVKTIYLQGAMRWDQMQPQAEGLLIGHFWIATLIALRRPD